MFVVNLKLLCIVPACSKCRRAGTSWADHAALRVLTGYQPASPIMYFCVRQFHLVLKYYYCVHLSTVFQISQQMNGLLNSTPVYLSVQVQWIYVQQWRRQLWWYPACTRVVHIYHFTYIDTASGQNWKNVSWYPNLKFSGSLLRNTKCQDDAALADFLLWPKLMTEIVILLWASWHLSLTSGHWRNAAHTNDAI